MKSNPKTPPAQRRAAAAWAARNPAAVQAAKDRWAKSPAGRAWLRKNQGKKNAARDRWRQRKRREARSTPWEASTNIPQHPTQVGALALLI